MVIRKNEYGGDYTQVELAGFLTGTGRPIQRKPALRNYPAFSSKAMLIFWVMTISLVTRNSRTFL
jgi:hypothetical protein